MSKEKDNTGNGIKAVATGDFNPNAKAVADFERAVHNLRTGKDYMHEFLSLLAAQHRCYYEELKREGFTHEEALELLKTRIASGN